MAASIEDVRQELIISGSVVTLREVLDKLDSLLSVEELDEFVVDILSEYESEVRPGELITADLMNRIIGQIANLNERVTVLENSVIDNRAPVITDINPREVRVGQRLEVIGYNFPEEISQGSVEIDNVSIERFIQASTERLVFGVPRTLIGLPKDAILRIRNGDLSASDEVHILPELNLPVGRVTAQDVTPALGEIIIGDDYMLIFEIRSSTDIQEIYSINLSFIDLSGTSTVTDWEDNSELVMADGSLVPTELLIVPGLPATVHVNATVPAGTVAGTVVLSATSLNNPAGIISTPASFRMVVGETPEENDPRTTFVLRDPTPTSRIRKVEEDGIVVYEVPYGDTQSIFVEAQYLSEAPPVSISGTYEYSVRFIPDRGPWVSLVVPDSSPEIVPSTEILRMQLELPAMTPDPEHPERRTLEIRAMHVADGNAGEFVSWTTVAIRGYERET